MPFSIDLPGHERKRLIKNDESALQRANLFEMRINDFIMQVEYLHFKGNLDANKIAAFYLIPKTESEVDFNDGAELIDYIRRIIETKKGERN